MPIHDWNRISADGFHTFHQDWTIEIRRALNRGGLPPDYFAMVDDLGINSETESMFLDGQRIERGGLRSPNRIVVRQQSGRAAAMIVVASPRDRDRGLGSKTLGERIYHLLCTGINVLLINLFPPTPRGHPPSRLATRGQRGI
jgi:hypothetical protein